jgi:type I restriction enzyme M protein
MERHGRNPKSLTLYGQEKNLNTWAICKMSLFLHDIDDAFVERGDTLLDPKHLSDEAGKTIRRFDLVIANPPFSLKQWGHAVWSKGDPYGRDVYGCPPRSYGDLAFVQHMIASMKPSGRMAVVVPHGVLFRGGAEGKIRKQLIDENLLKGVVGLPANLFFGAGIPAALVFLDRGKTDDKVFFIDASREFEKGTNQNKLRPEHIEKIVATWEARETVEKYAYLATLEEIRENDYNLNIPRYVDTFEEEEEIDIQAVQKEIDGLEAELGEVREKMAGYLKELGF